MDYNIHMTKNNHGFTLIELIVSMAVFAILVAIAAPSFNSFTDSSRRASQVNNFTGALSYARSEAIKRGNNISVCSRTTASTETCGGSWANGWLVFEDLNSDGIINSGETILRVFGQLSTGSTIVDTIGGVLFVTYRSSGFINSIATFKYCGNRGAVDARAIIISKTGRARLSRDGTDTDKIHEDHNNANLTCP